jgi:two-component system, OmpR family, phosphate regulon sensor histidine kinase PhoR
MLNRLSQSLVLTGVTAGLGHAFIPAQDSWAGAAAGAALGLAIALAIDIQQGQRLEAWLKGGQWSHRARVGQAWSGWADRIWRIFRMQRRELTESEGRLQRFLSAIQVSPNGVVLLDGEGRIEWLNQTASQHFGLDPHGDLQQHIVHLVRDPIFVAYIEGDSYDKEIVMAAPRQIAGHSLRLAVHLHEYGLRRKLLLSRDVTALELADAMRRDFVANVSHEIRTPLTVLSGFVETLQTLNLSDVERVKYLALMAEQSHRMEVLVHDLLTLSRLEGSPQPSLQEWTPVGPLLDKVVQESRALSIRLSEGGHDIQVTTEEGWMLAGAPSELQSAFGNLMNNAVRYTPAGGTVKLDWHVNVQGQGQFTVTDTGPGIAAEHLPRLTERFYRIDRSRSRETGGTGLGLAIVKHVAQRHGADLLIESHFGRGSRFGIVFPSQRLRKQP